MKKTVMTLLLTVLCASVHAFFPCYDPHYSSHYYPDAVLGVAHDEGNIYVVRHDGFVVIDKATGGKTVFSKSQGTLDYSPTAVAVEPGGHVWIGTSEGVLLKYDGSGMTVCDLGLECEVSNIFFDAQGLMDVTAFYGAVYRIAGNEVMEQFELSHVKYSDGGFTAFICQSQDGALWMAGNALNGGLRRFGTVRYTSAEGIQYVYEDYPDYNWGEVCGLTAGNDGSLWFVHDRDLNRMVDGELTLQCVFPCTVWGMMFDDQQRLWVSGFYGPLMKVDNGEVTIYDCPYESNLWTCLDVDGDDVYIGTDSQLLMFRDGTFTTLDVEVTTAITPPLQATAQSAPAARYNLQGRRIDGTPTRSGLYIKDGRKVVVR